MNLDMSSGNIYYFDPGVNRLGGYILHSMLILGQITADFPLQKVARPIGKFLSKIFWFYVASRGSVSTLTISLNQVIHPPI